MLLVIRVDLFLNVHHLRGAKNQSTVTELTRDLAGGDLITLGSLQVRLPDSQHIS